jgi:NADPH2:quinone reductase
MTIPASMRHIAITFPGDTTGLALARGPVPSIGSNDVLIEVAAAGVNGPDIAQRRGHYDPPADASPILGLEVAGHIAALGNAVTGFELGDSVMALTNGGGYAEYVAVPAGQILPIPTGWALTEAAALPETWLTVTQTLVMRSQLAAGMSVLIHGASGGIGGAAIQICRIIGAIPIAVVSSDDKAAYAKRLGAAATINYQTEDIIARALELTGGKGVDRVLDVVGGDMAAINIAACAKGGHIVQVATLASGITKISLGHIMAKQLTLSGSTLRPQLPQVKSAIASHIADHFLPALGEPAFVRPQITSFPLADVAQAHQFLESRQHLGKIILTTDFGASL